jgi:transposase
MTKPDVRTFSREFKLKALERIERGETISALSVEFGVHRQLLYKWRDADRAGRLGARRGRPTKAGWEIRGQEHYSPPHSSLA